LGSYGDESYGEESCGDESYGDENEKKRALFKRFFSLGDFYLYFFFLFSRL
jgi:hypothetical protein